MGFPVFILGIARSGTSVALRLVEASPDVHVARFEPHLLMQACAWLRHPRVNMPAARQRGSLSVLSPNRWAQVFRDEVEAFRREFAEQTVAVKLAFHLGGGSPWGEESWWWTCLPEYFPTARYLFLRRNIHDLYESRRTFLYERNRAGTHSPLWPKVAMQACWRTTMESYERYVEAHPDRAAMLDYDAFVEDPIGATNRIWLPLGIESPGGRIIERIARRPKHWQTQPEGA